MSKRLGKMVYTIRHKIAFARIWLSHETKVSFWRMVMHDMDKLFMIPFVGVDKASKIHFKFAGHHLKRTEEDFYEAYLDWASARQTKPDKPLDAIQTAERWYPNLVDKARSHCEEVGFK